MTMENIPW